MLLLLPFLIGSRGRTSVFLAVYFIERVQIYRKIKKLVQRGTCTSYFHTDCPIFSVLHQYGSSGKINDRVLTHYYSLGPKFILISLVVPYSLFPFSVLGSHTGHHVSFSCHVSLGSTWCDGFLDLTLFWGILKVLRNTGQVVYSMSPH